MHPQGTAPVGWRDWAASQPHWRRLPDQLSCGDALVGTTATAWHNITQHALHPIQGSYSLLGAGCDDALTFRYKTRCCSGPHS